MFKTPAATTNSMAKLTPTYQEQSLIPILTAADMLHSLRWQKQIKLIEERIKIPAEFYQEVYAPLLTRFADFVQVIPTIAGGLLGGILDEGLQRGLLALEAQDESATAESDPLFTYALFTAALLLDLRQLFVNKKIMLADNKGNFIAEWSPLLGTMQNTETTHYRIRHFRRPMLSLSPYLTILLAKQVIPEAGLAWLGGDLRLLNMWLAALCGDDEGGGGIAHFLKLIKLRLRQAEPKPRLIIPVDITIPEENKLGEAFWLWLRNVVAAGEENTTDPALHLTDDLVFLEVPKIFQEFCDAEKLPNWKEVYQQFMQLGIAGSTGEEGEEKTPEQLFIYLNKGEVLPEKAQIKLKEIKVLAKSFFNQTAAQSEIASREQLKKANYEKQGMLMAERAWFFRVSRKIDAQRDLQLAKVKQKRLQQYAALHKFLALRAAFMKKHLLSGFRSK